MGTDKILFIGGSMNQTTMMHQIAQHLMDEYDCYFTTYYSDGFLGLLAKARLLEFTVMGEKRARQSREYFEAHHLKTDYGGTAGDYDLVVSSSDLVIQRNIADKKIVLVQEGMTDPEKWTYHLVKTLKLPRYLAGTSTTGLSDAYEKFCVASEGYRDLFIRKGVKPEKIVVTGIPNFDNVKRFLDNDFPHKHYVLVATSDARETLKIHNRKKFIQYALDIAGDRQVIFKLHPNEKKERAVREIKALAPHALIYTEGNTDEMIANCDVLITQYSTVNYVGLALGKEVHSYDLDVAELRKLTPWQNGGKSSEYIAEVCRNVIKGTST
ncbi:MAG: hypothetical protein D6675_01620 [Gemmatimonadetes bacterium]|nr:MAG: hypothetical protein D6675_01620 [Gemmatimonadota bacterium]